ncbi:MAG: RecX family transcriptional regulator [candidate division WOR-3 bacterium]
MKITKLSRQKRKSDRFSLYLDGSFVTGLSAETVARLHLAEGKEIDSVQLQKAISQEESQKALNYAYRLLSYRARSEKEISERLANRGYSETVINQTLAELKRAGLIDDKEFALIFIQDRLNLAKRGKRAIYTELLRKGVAKSVIERALKEINQDETDIAKALVKKYAKRYQKLEPEKRKKRLYDLLLRRGFTFKTIEAVLGVV